MKSNKCSDYGKAIGIIHIPTKAKYMCLSIRRYYVKKRMLAFGYTRDEISNVLKWIL